MSRLIDEYTKNKSPEDKKEVERRVREMAGTMSELSALMLVLEEMRQEGKKDGGIMRIGFKGGADMATVSGDTRAATAKSANVSPTGNVTTSRDKGPDPVDDRGSAEQNFTQYLVNQGMSPREIRRITGKPSIIDKIKKSPINNPFTRGVLRTGLYTLNPSLGAVDFRKAMQLKNLYDYTKGQINEPVDEEDMTIGFSKGGRIGLKNGNGVADEEAENAKFVKRVRELMDEGFDMGEAVKEAMKEGYANGGRIGLKGGTTALKAILNFFAKESGKRGSEGLKSINPKSVDSSILNIMGPEHTKLLQTNRKEYLENLLDVIKSDKKLLDEIKVKYPEDIQPMIYKMANEGGNKGRLDVYKNIDINEAITDVETMVKNMELAGGRKLNSDGGRIGLKEGYRPGAPIDPLDPQRKISEAMDAYDKYYKGPGKKVRKIPFMKFFEIYAKENFADGGRVGLKVGSMSKRAFLKMLAALGITGAAAKSGILSLGGKQSGKQVVKEIVKTPNVTGKPEWFDSLVNKVIAEGVDKTDDLAYKERMVVHTKKINPNEEVAVYQDLEDGSVRINVGGHMTDKDGNVIRAVNDPDQVDLIVRQGKTEEGGFKTKDSFEAVESEPRVANQDGDIEFDGENVVNNVDDLMQDVSNLEEYATGKKLTGTKKKKAVEKQEKFQKFTEDKSAQSDYLVNKYGEGDYASGGIARMLGE